MRFNESKYKVMHLRKNSEYNTLMSSNDTAKPILLEK